MEYCTTPARILESITLVITIRDGLFLKKYPKTTMRKFICLIALMAAPFAESATITLSTVADTVVFHRDGTYTYNTTNYGSAGQLDTSQYGAAIWAMSYIRFDLSSIPAGAVIDSAVFQVTKGTTANIANFNVVRNDTITTGRFGSYGLLDVSGNTDQNWSETTLTSALLGSERISGANPQFETSSRTIDLNAATETLLSSSTVVEVSGSPLVSFLQGRLDASTNTGMATIIVDYMEDASGGARGYSFASKENSASLNPPNLVVNYTVVPESSATLLGGLGVLGLLFRRRA